ncbi:MAG: hypothetical protein ACRCX2_24760 [Paraclostridium sp.]
MANRTAKYPRIIGSMVDFIITAMSTNGFVIIPNCDKILYAIKFSRKLFVKFKKVHNFYLIMNLNILQLN